MSWDAIINSDAKFDFSKMSPDEVRAAMRGWASSVPEAERKKVLAKLKDMQSRAETAEGWLEMIGFLGQVVQMGVKAIL